MTICLFHLSQLCAFKYKLSNNEFYHTNCLEKGSVLQCGGCLRKSSRKIHTRLQTLDSKERM